MTGVNLLFCQTFSIVFHVHGELIGAGSGTILIARLTTSIAILEMWGTLTACVVWGSKVDSYFLYSKICNFKDKIGLTGNMMSLPALILLIASSWWVRA